MSQYSGREKNSFKAPCIFKNFSETMADTIRLAQTKFDPCYSQEECRSFAFLAVEMESTCAQLRKAFGSTGVVDLCKELVSQSKS